MFAVRGEAEDYNDLLSIFVFLNTFQVWNITLQTWKEI